MLRLLRLLRLLLLSLRLELRLLLPRARPGGGRCELLPELS